MSIDLDRERIKQQYADMLKAISSDLLIQNKKHMDIIQENEKTIDLIDQDVVDKTLLAAFANLDITDIPINIVMNCLKHKDMFKAYAKECPKKYIELKYALKNTNEHEIIIFYPELELYGVFLMKATSNDVELLSLNQFIGNLSTHFGITDCKLQQVVIGYLPSRFIFLAINKQHIITKFTEIIKIHLNSDVNITPSISHPDYVEIMVLNKVASSLDVMEEVFIELQDYIKSNSKEDVLKMMKLPDTSVMTMSNKEELCKFISLELQKLVDKKYKETFAQGPVIHIHNDYSHNSGNIHIASHNTTNTTNNTKLLYSTKTNRPNMGNEASKWIRANPPFHDEQSASYYKRYVDYQGGKHYSIHNTIFTPLVYKEGFKYREDRFRARFYINEKNVKL
jgi:hypothetical protein